jgi:uncharacterized protein involved in exopolysaccharide biosynthesis
MIARSTQAESTARDVCRPLFRHKRKMIAALCAVMGLVIVGVTFFPRTYISEARVFVRMGKESVALDPTATVGQTVTMSESRESEINSELEILRSQILLRDVVDKLGADYILGNDGKSTWLNVLATPLSALNNWLNSTRGISKEEYAVLKLKKRIIPSVPRKSNVISISCKARNPKKAQEILATFVEAYLTRHGQANRTAGSYAFFVEQSTLLREQLENATDELRKAKNETALVSIDGQRLSLQTQMDSIEAAQLDNQRSLAAAEARADSLQKAFDKMPDRLVADEMHGPPDHMRTELYKLQMEEREASSRNTDENPKVRALRRQVKEMEAILAGQQEQRMQSTRKTNPSYQQMEVELVTQQSLVASLKAEGISLGDQQAQIAADIRKLNDNEFRITELVRRTELLDHSYRNYVNNREQARIDRELEQDRISNTNVLQPATYSAKPSSPKVRLTLFLGFVLAMISALLAAAIAEYLDRSLKTPGEIERSLNVPVLLSVPRISRDALLSN